MTTPSGKNQQPAFLKRDLTLLLTMPSLFRIAWMHPRRHWLRYCKLFAPRLKSSVYPRPETVAAKVARSIDPALDLPPPEAIVEQTVFEHLFMLFEYARSYRPGRWDAEITLQGFEHYQSARSEQRAAIFWFAPFAHLDLTAKAALFNANISFHHLSRPTHGLSGSKFAVKYLNRFMIRAENRYIAERVVLDPENAGVALLKLARILRAGGDVSVTAARPRFAGAAAFIKAPLLGRPFEFAQGAPLLARKTGAALLPVVALRDDEGTYRVMIGEDINPPGGRVGPSAQMLVERFAKAIEPSVRAWPGQWRGWMQL